MLVLAGSLDLAAAALHLACIVGGPDWYRFFGAGEEIARAAERGSPIPAVITVGIACVLTVWGLLAFSAAGLIGKLPLRRLCLVLISLVYLVRGVGPFAAAVATGWAMDAFWIWSSLICLGCGLAHAIGTAQVWRRL